MNLLIGITGSIGALGILNYLVLLKNKFRNLKTIMTPSAERFIPSSSISLIAGNVYTQIFTGPDTENHIHLAAWADLFVVIPATANILAETASGAAGSLLTLTVLAHKKPLLFFPNMDDTMWNNPATRRNVNLLREYGHLVIDPVPTHAYLATPERNPGEKSMPPPQQAFTIIEQEMIVRESGGRSLNHANI